LRRKTSTGVPGHANSDIDIFSGHQVLMGGIERQADSWVALAELFERWHEDAGCEGRCATYVEMAAAAFSRDGSSSLRNRGQCLCDIWQVITASLRQ
jgi:hypothetical protein